MQSRAARLIQSVLLSALLFSTAACAALRADREPRIIRYICRLGLVEPFDRFGTDRLADGPLGNLSLTAIVKPNRQSVTYSRRWTADLEAGMISLRASWRGPAAMPPPATRLHISLALPPGGRAWVRLIIHRNGPQGERVSRSSSFSPPWRWLEEMSWRRFETLMGDADALHLALVRRDGAIVAQGFVPRSMLAAPAEAAAAHRAELQQALADPDRHCNPGTDSPIVLA